MKNIPTVAQSLTIIQANYRSRQMAVAPSGCLPLTGPTLLIGKEQEGGTENLVCSDMWSCATVPLAVGTGTVLELRTWASGSVFLCNVLVKESTTNRMIVCTSSALCHLP